jgi:hypothetical protein
MDYADFEAAQRIVAELLKCMEILPESTTHPRPFQAIRGDLTDFLFHVYHHTLGGRTIATDLDFVEVRDGEIAALIELKKFGRTMSPTQELVTGTIAKALDVPVYLLYADAGFTRFVVQKPKEREELKFDRRGFKAFMQDFRVPTSLDQLY